MKFVVWKPWHPFSGELASADAADANASTATLTIVATSDFMQIPLLDGFAMPTTLTRGDRTGETHPTANFL
ncbi:MAG: hypothetical protein ACRDLU_00985 [Gaiellaceae bacterium]